MGKSKLASLLLIISFLILIRGFALAQPGSNAGILNPNQVYDYEAFIKTVNITGVKEHIKYLSDTMYRENRIPPTRATGTRGNELALQYIHNKFKEYGLKDITIHKWTEPAVPLSYGANITVQGVADSITLYPILPNLISPSTTPPEGITGTLIYASNGYLADFDGVKVEGSIVLLNWETENRWLNAVKLGAKAVIFLPPDEPDRSFSPYGNRWNTKYLVNVPLLFPRFFVNGTRYEGDAKVLLDHVGDVVTVRSTVVWQEVTGKNIFGLVRGTEQPDIIFGIASYYDSYSVAPDYAPGAQEACGVAALLELAKYFANHPAKASLIFIAFGGHHQLLAGSRWWMNDYYAPWTDVKVRTRPGPDPKKEDLASKIWFNFILEPFTGSDAIYRAQRSVAFRMSTSGAPMTPFPCNDHLTRLTNEINAAKPGGKIYKVLWDNYGNEGVMVIRIADEAQPVSCFPSDGNSFWTMDTAYVTITTAYDIRPYFMTPQDTFSRVNFDNLKTQLEYTHALILRFLQEDPVTQIKTYLSGYAYETVQAKTWGSPHYGSVLGQVGKWTPEKVWYTPIPNALVEVHHALRGSSGDTPLEFDRRVTFADAQSRFETAGGYPGQDWGVFCTAWVLNSSTGEVILGPDLGRYKYYRYPSVGMGETANYNYDDLGWVTVYNFSMVVLLDSILPESLFSMTETGEWTPPLVWVHDFESHVDPEHYALLQEAGVGLSIILVPTNTSVELVMGRSGERYPGAILVNATEKYPLGTGYKFKPGQTVITLPILRYAENLRWIVGQRFGILGAFKPTGVGIYKQYTGAVEKIEMAYKALSNYQYSTAYNYTIEAWTTLRAVYLNQRTEIESSSMVAPYLAAFLVPFTFLAEKLLFKASGAKRITSTVGIFVVLMSALYLVHPAFVIAGSPTMIVIGISTLILLFPIIFIIFGKVGALITSLRIRFLGKHEAEISKAEELSTALLTGIENMRKRRFRTGLILVSVIIMVSSLVAFTSVSPYSFLKKTPFLQGAPAYQGALIHRDHWGLSVSGHMLGEMVESYLKTRYADRAVVAPRAWRYTFFPQPPHINYSNCGYKVVYEGKIWQPHTILGLSAEEALVTGIGGKKLPLTEGRWFEEGDTYACILTTAIAKRLGVTGPSTIKVHDISFTVVGIIDGELLRFFKDMDGETVTPIEQDILPAQNTYEIHTEPYDTLIVTYKVARNLFGGEVASVAMKIENASLVESIAKEIFAVLPSLNVYLCSNVAGGKVEIISRGTAVSVMGLESQIVPLAIVLFSMLNLILGAVHERRREIATYSSLGLSPMSIAFMFIGETLIYAVLAGIVGFITGTFMLKMVSSWIALPISYTATSFNFAVGLSMLVVMLASLYPAFTAARLVTPSLERAWKMPTAPVGDLWEVPLPFFAYGEDETNGILAFLYEFMQAHLGADTPIFSVTNVNFEEGTLEQRRYKGLRMMARLFPYEAGVNQESLLFSLEHSLERWELRVLSERKTGLRDTWMGSYRNFVDEIRKQLLLWRSLKPEAREHYYEMFKEAKR